MDSPKAGLAAFGEQVQAALEAETQPSEQIRLARSRLLERVTSTTAAPASVAWTGLVRTSSSRPSCCSRALMRCETADGVSRSRRAA